MKKKKNEAKVKKIVEEEEDSDSDNLDEDETFAKDYLSIRQGALTQTTNSSTSNKITSNGSSSGANAMGLDGFSFAGSRRAEVRRGFTNLELSEKEKKDLKFPIYDDYQYILACAKCFVKISEGIKGYRHIPDETHICQRDILLVRPYVIPHPGWMKVRLCPDTSHLNISRFQPCRPFQLAKTCTYGESRCMYTHNKAEHTLWTFQKDGFFNINTFITTARKFNLYNSALWEKAMGLHHSASKAAIPGMNYKTTSGSASSSTMSHPTGAMGYNQSYVVNQPQAQSYNNLPSYEGASVQAYETKSQYEPNPIHNTINPLPSLYDYKIVCKNCLKRTDPVGKYQYFSHPHICEQNLLVVMYKTVPSFWMLVRERFAHRDFLGHYKICDSVTFNRLELCKFQDSCTFAHNAAEKDLWEREKSGTFSVTDFIIKNRRLKPSTEASSNDILKKYPGRFAFLCRACFFYEHRISYQNDNVCNLSHHVWSEQKTLAHIGETDITIIGPRGFTHETAFFKICKFLHFCQRAIMGECRFAHSMIERDVWMLERDTGISREQIVNDSHQPQPVQSNDTRGYNTRSPTPDLKVTPDSTILKRQFQTCPFSIQQLCEICWKHGNKSYQDGDKDQCKSSHPHQNWNRNNIFLLTPSNKILRPLPRKIPPSLNFVFCSHMQKKNRCDYTLGGPCQFAHSQEEVDVWKWMVMNQVQTLEDLYQHSKESQKAKSGAKNNIQGGESVVSASPLPLPIRSHIAMPIALDTSAHYCRYCAVKCNSQKQFDQHCSSEKHMSNVNSDKEHQWNHRQPPWGVPAEKYQLCYKHLNNGGCEYSSKPEMYNQCRYAHSEEELDEWRERYKWREMKRTIAQQEGLFSYMDQLLEKYETAVAGSSVMLESMDGVEIQSDQKENVDLKNKNSSFTWRFNVQTSDSLELKKVALLYNSGRLHFALSLPQAEGNFQMLPGETFSIPGQSNRYSVEVKFTGGMFGSFQQWVIFDFGLEIVVVRKLFVEIGEHQDHRSLWELRQKLEFDHWTSENREVVPFPKKKDPFESHVRRYKCPDIDSVITQESILQPLNSHNYSHKMSKLAQLEEITRHQILAKYNLCTTMFLSNTISESGEFLNAVNNELFARVNLTEELNEDTDAGQLIITSVRYVLLAPVNNSQRKVYEAEIIPSEVGKGRDYVYIRLSQKCCKSLGLKSGSKMSVEIQFQLDRLSFCKMRLALDRVDADLVFPDISKLNPKWSEEHMLQISSNSLNEDQLAAIRHIVADRQGYVPPLVMYGPFGTGKTETLAQAAMVLLTETTTSRVLICTVTNSAANLYISRHLGEFVKKKGLQNKLVRLLHDDRRLETIDKDSREFYRYTSSINTKQDLMQYRICVVTIAVSLELVLKGMDNMFTHIFVDEAAQGLEPDTIMPLCLANKSTCIVLAGDHIQMSPKVYSEEAKRLCFHESFLERIYKYYEAHSAYINMKNSPKIFLTINYRSKMEILRFLASVFYGGPDVLTSRSNITAVPQITPLTFYAVQGHEVQDPQRTSFFNIAEAEEIVDRVAELLSKWPEQWGTRNPEQICVLSPYEDQIRQIRFMLRTKSKELKTVSVHKVSNVPGREFRAVFLSTVRTQHILDRNQSADVRDFGFLSDPKLLNTALTRAQSLVAVVGDPVGLCAIGECMTIWRTFLKHCQNMKSIHPNNITLDQIRQQVTHALHCADSGNLEESAREHQDTVSPQSVGPAEHGAESGVPIQTNLSQATGYTGGPIQTNLSQATGYTGVPIQTNLSQATGYTGGTPMYEGLPHSNGYSGASSIPERPLNALAAPFLSAKQQKTQPKKPLKPLASPNTVLGSNAQLLSDFDTVSKIPIADILKGIFKLDKKTKKRPFNERYPVTEKEGYAVISGDTEGGSASNILQTRVSSKYLHMSTDDLLHLVKAKSDVIKLCLLHCNSERIFARVLDESSSHGDIEISCRGHCMKAFHHDQVFVEVFTTSDDEVSVQEFKKGQVVGIHRRHLDLKSKLMVCMSDMSNPGLLTPINTQFPKIYNLCTSKALKAGKDGLVTHYDINGTEIKVDSFVSAESDKLFVVRYLSWEWTSSHPVGIVVGVIPAGNTVGNSMLILDIEHCLYKQYLQDITQNLSEEETLPEDLFASRQDFRDRSVFSVSQTSTEVIDNALSIQQVTNDSYMIGIHVSDVTHYVQPGSRTDKEAALKGASFHPLEREPIQMIPSKLSNHLCNLSPNAERLTVSVFLTVSSSGQVVNVETSRCVIKAKNFSYSQVQEIIEDPESVKDYVKSCILVLYQIAEVWQRNRLGNASLVSNSNRTSPKAHVMVDEVMAMANEQVAKLLLIDFRHQVPLYSKETMNPAALIEWKKKYATIAVNSVAFTQAFLKSPAVCQCKMACICIFGFVKEHNIKMESDVSVLSSLWDSMTLAANSGDSIMMKDLIVQTRLHPHQLIALVHLQEIQFPAKYVCSGEVDISSLAPIVHFSRPLQRYMDLVVLRLICAHMDSKHSPYTSRDISEICDRSNIVADTVKSYQKACTMLYISEALQAKPLVVYPVVERVSSTEIRLCFPTLSDLGTEQRTLQLSSLHTSEPPNLDAENKSVDLKWQERVYELPSKEPKKGQAAAERCIELNPNRFICKVPSYNWQRLLTAVRESNPTKLMATFGEIKNTAKNPYDEGRFGRDVTSEPSKGTKIDEHFCDFSVELSKFSVVKAQVTCGVFRGMLSPHVQLISLTSRLDICIEHDKDPLVFTGNTSLPNRQESPRDIKEYQKRWLSLVDLESMTCSVERQSSFILHNVSIQWQDDRQSKFGVFQLSLAFCQERCIKLVNYALDRGGTIGTDSNRTFDYLCVRYAYLDLPEDLALINAAAEVVNTGESVTWTGHCVIQSVSVDKPADCVTIHIQLQDKSTQLPTQLLQNPPECSLEWIPKLSHFRDMEEALCDIENCPTLIQNIALGQTLSEPGNGAERRPQNGNSNVTIVKKCLDKPFSVIHGHPGSGKTETAARLAQLMAKWNKSLCSNVQVLLCGPTELSVDILANRLKSFGSECPDIVRVYSEEIEKGAYPLPGEVLSKKEKAMIPSADLSLTDISLHHRLRESTNPNSQAISESDMLFMMYPNDISQSQTEEFLELKTKAEKEELKKAEVILCTCAVSSRLKSCENIKQVIIDDSSLCTEPETLIPLVSCKPRQVVLIGDYQHQRPDVSCRLAAQHGLDKPMVARFEEIVSVLNTQCRMQHEEIARFPLTHFYGSNPRINSPFQTNPSKANLGSGDNYRPLLFIDVHGLETVSKHIQEVRHTPSYSNNQQTNLAVQLAVKFLRQPGRKLGIITPYESQSVDIQKELSKLGCKGATVTTLQQSYGCTFDFVILTTVRSMPLADIEVNPDMDWKRKHLGFLQDSSLTVVALTRARLGLVILGNQELLRCDEDWGMLIHELEMKGNCQGELSSLGL